MNNIKNFENKKVKVFTKSNFIYKGECLLISEKSIQIMDHKEGLVLLAMDQVATLKIWKPSGVKNVK